jgi:hypothetical protein
MSRFFQFRLELNNLKERLWLMMLAEEWSTEGQLTQVFRIEPSKIAFYSCFFLD